MSMSTSTSTGEDGNPAVISKVSATPDAIAFASDGLVQTTGSGVIPINFQGSGQSVVVTIKGESNALKAIATRTNYNDTSNTALFELAGIHWLAPVPERGDGPTYR